MSTWAPNVYKNHDTGLGRSRSGAAVTGIWLHHQANGGGADSVAYMAGPNSRDSHPTYATDKKGRVHAIVHPDKMPSSTFAVNDRGAVTIEIANIAGAPNWDVPDAAVEAVAQVIAHHAKESPRANRAERNKPGTVQSGFWVGYHSQVGATACPGPDVLGKLDRIIARANEILGGAKPAAPAKPAKKPAARPKAEKPFRTPTAKFPLPSGWYFGPESGPVQSVSGYHGRRDAVRQAQKLMQDRGYDFSEYGIDGLYGSEFRGNILHFQRQEGLTADGLLGIKTWVALHERPVK